MVLGMNKSWKLLFVTDFVGKLIAIRPFLLCGGLWSLGVDLYPRIFICTYYIRFSSTESMLADGRQRASPVHYVVPATNLLAIFLQQLGEPRNLNYIVDRANRCEVR